jgi:thioesterase domain-containing protein
LVGYVVPAAGAAPTPAWLAERLREQLPAYLVPSAFVLLDRMPRTLSGKLDRGTLPPPGMVRGDAGYQPPRNPTELRLVRIWEELLGVGPVGMRDDFFLLGGHSLLAVRLMALIDRRFGRRLPPTALLPDATVERLARRLTADRPPAEWEPLVVIQPGDGRPPLFCVHPAGGSVLCYVDLARRLSPGYPVYGLQGPDPRGPGEPVEDAVALAAVYRNVVTAAWPHGPYLLAGYSFGGLIAYEIARQLHDRGGRVGLLAMLDTGAPQACGVGSDRAAIRELADTLEGYDLDRLAADPAREKQLWDELTTLAERHAAEPADGRGRRARGMAAIQEFFQARRLLPVEAGIGYAEIHRFMRLLRANFRAARGYRPVPSPHRLTLFRTGDSSGDQDGWVALAAGLEMHRVPGTHFDLLGPETVAAVADRLRACIDRVG